MKLSNCWIYILSVFLMILFWKILSMAISSPVLPAPEAALVAFAEAFKTSRFWGHFGTSSLRVISAMALSWAIAFPLGIMLGYSPKLNRLISPFIFLTYPIPKIVFLPIILVLFGLGDASKIALLTLIISYQILVATRDGVAAVNKRFIDTIKSLGGERYQIIKQVLIPAALPHCFTSLRISTGTGIAVLFFVESFATSQGLGYYIMDSWGKAAYNQMFVGIIGMSLLGALLYGVFGYLERSLCRWKLLESGQPVSPEDTLSQKSIQIATAVKRYGRMVKFSHTIFAMPFALTALVLAQKQVDITLPLVILIIIAVIGARSAAMGFNRLVDARIDAANPRTAGRAIPEGRLTKKSAVVFIIISSLAFIIAAALISKMCFYLSVPVLLILFFYSFTKRFTAYSHLVLGFAIGMAPLGVWVAVTGTLSWEIAILSVALLTYIAGFDILYACQDVEFDKKHGIFSMPANFGIRFALHISSLLHMITFLSLLSLYLIFDMGVVYFVFIIIIGILFLIEHRLVDPHDLSQINVAFSHVNSAISVILFLGVFLDEIVSKGIF